jgi:hypothetical protein
VTTLEKSAAEITFRDTSALYLRENTLVVIYAGQAQQARLATSDAYLERGALRTFLGQLRMSVLMPSASATIQGGAALLDVDESAASRLSNFEGAGVGLKSAAGGQIEVQPGFGSKVVQHQPPTPPKPLPPTPAWDASVPSHFVSLAMRGGSVAGAWQAVPEAAAYRVELSTDAEGKQLVVATQVPATVTRFEAHFLPPGQYYARVSSIDVDRFESRPSPQRIIALTGLGVTEPGKEPSTTFDPGDPSRDPTPPELFAGSVLQVPAELRCRIDEGPLGLALRLDTAGSHQLACESSAGQALAPLELRVSRPRFTRASVGPADGATLYLGRSRSLSFRVDPKTPLEALDTQLDTGLRLVETLHWDGLGVARFGVEATELGRKRAAIVVRGTQPPLPLQTTWLQVATPPTPPAGPTPAVLPQSDVLRGPASPDLQQVRELPPTAAAYAAIGYLGGAQHAADHAFRMTVGARAALFSKRLMLEASYTRDLLPLAAFSQQARGLQLGAGLYHERTRRLQLAGVLSTWLPTGSASRDLRYLRLQPSLQAVFAVTDALRLQTHQAAVLGLGAHDALLWSSSYALQAHVLGPWCAGGGVDLGIGRLADARFTGLAAQLGVGLVAAALQLSVQARLALTDDQALRFGRFGVSGDLAVIY